MTSRDTRPGVGTRFVESGGRCAKKAWHQDVYNAKRLYSSLGYVPPEELKRNTSSVNGTMVWTFWVHSKG